MNITYLALPHCVIRPASASEKERFHTPGYGAQVPFIGPHMSVFLSVPSNITRLVSPTRMRRSTPWLQCRHRFFSSMDVLLGYRPNLAAFSAVILGACKHSAAAATIRSLSICIYVKGS
ncbi:hypothetical protein COCMIDRAFT_35689 [Bipolaris oryzae ATCC 44560]|uniref:Uncharacterized protein n=1 Tax=Bipolaris oryzae ATCC 44560 TaxID=930090 RepID=W6ZAA2_COCMI|nr:uncharacterized protein COCMIDRAFT_35689 [Bipolaris oryzae ATCC 44560]EUC46698.1 hypothetical protein COCMIDRAFT_35689 [Bipolaris oryzae ATCC 44560]